MGFEKRVLEVVEQTLGSANSAEFSCGTLFVGCTVAEAVQLETALLKAFQAGIVLSRVGEESAFDFV